MMYRTLLVAWLISLAPMAVHAADSSAAPTLDAVAWMAGCWDNEEAEPGSREQWTAPAGGTMFGVSWTLKGGATGFYEFMILRQTEADELELVALPMGRSQTAFRMIESGEQSAVFENLENDFPQRIRYWLEGNDHLKARIEGDVQGELRTSDFSMVRGDCP